VNEVSTWKMWQRAPQVAAICVGTLSGLPSDAAAQAKAESTAVFVALGAEFSAPKARSVRSFLACDTLAGPCEQHAVGYNISSEKGIALINAFAEAAAVPISDELTYVCSGSNEDDSVGYSVWLGQPRFEGDSAVVKVISSCRYRRRDSWLTGSQVHEYSLRRIDDSWRVVGRRLTQIVNE